MANDIWKQIIEKHKFYQSNFHRLLRILGVSGVLNLILLLLLIYAFVKPESVKFVAVNSDGQLEQLVIKDKVVFSDQMVTNWISINIPKIYNIDFLNYKQQMQQAKEIFDQHGWLSFTNAFSPVIKQVVTDKLVMSASVSGVPMVIARGSSDDTLLWKIQIPILIQYQNSDKSSDSSAIVTVVIKEGDHSRLYIAQLIQSDHDGEGE